MQKTQGGVALTLRVMPGLQPVYLYQPKVLRCQAARRHPRGFPPGTEASPHPRASCTRLPAQGAQACPGVGGSNQGEPGRLQGRARPCWGWGWVGRAGQPQAAAGQGVGCGAGRRPPRGGTGLGARMPGLYSARPSLLRAQAAAAGDESEPPGFARCKVGGAQAPLHHELLEGAHVSPPRDTRVHARPCCHCLPRLAGPSAPCPLPRVPAAATWGPGAPGAPQLPRRGTASCHGNRRPLRLCFLNRGRRGNLAACHLIPRRPARGAGAPAPSASASSSRLPPQARGPSSLLLALLGPPV